MEVRQGAVDRLVDRIAAILGGTVRGALGGAFLGLLGMLNRWRFQDPAPVSAPLSAEVAIPFLVGSTLFFALLGAVNGARVGPRPARLLGALCGLACVIPFGLQQGATLEYVLIAMGVAAAGALLAGLRAELP